MVRLDSGDFRSDDRAREQRVLAPIFEVAAVARIARKIDATSQHYVEAGRTRFGADHPTAIERDVGVPCRGRGDP